MGDDGLIADEVGEWAKEKHSYLTRYIDISHGARQRFIGPGKAGATYFDPFCATGRSKVRGTGEWIDGSAVAAWKASVASGAPFTQVFISDIDQACVDACTARLKKLNAPVTAICADAVSAVPQMISGVNNLGLHLALLDPYNLELDFRIIQGLSALKRVDLVIHLSAMDLQRNLANNLKGDESAFDVLAPGWRDSIDLAASKQTIRAAVIEYWRGKVAALGKWPSATQRLITGEKHQPLYWLLLASGHQLAQKFWGIATNPEKQGELF